MTKKELEEFKEKLRGSTIRLFGKLYNSDQLFNEELLTSDMKPYPKNEEIEDFIMNILDDVCTR